MQSLNLQLLEHHTVCLRSSDLDGMHRQLCDLYHVTLQRIEFMLHVEMEQSAQPEVLPLRLLLPSSAIFSARTLQLFRAYRKTCLIRVWRCPDDTAKACAELPLCAACMLETRRCNLPCASVQGSTECSISKNPGAQQCFAHLQTS